MDYEQAAALCNQTLTADLSKLPATVVEQIGIVNNNVTFLMEASKGLVAFCMGGIAEAAGQKCKE